ncbi:hypothetical protein DV735_g5001, partial [Chaetothyriales sp. CBS 134920]
MSTFDGYVQEFPSIRIDYFRHRPDRPPPAACFLTHVHSDHLQGLETLKMPFVYCSATTRRLLLRMEKYPCRINFANGILESRSRTYKHLRLVLRALPLHTCTEIELNPLQKIQVVLFDANHCPGAVSFLIQDQASAIFYTGDIRAEPWWVNSLVQNPYIMPYTCGIKTLDCIYLDTTFASHNCVYRRFPSKADGLKELLQKLTQYPPSTVFYFRAWTLGYEQVWMAMSSLLSSQIHVGEYQLRLFHAITEHSRDGYAMFEAPPLVGFTIGNQQHPGCLTLSSDTRVHSCEPGLKCHSHLNQADTVWVSPIVSRLEDGSELLEVGAGGGLGDLNPTAELEIDDPALLGQLSSLCAALRINRALLGQLQDAIATAQASAMARLPLDGLGLDGDDISTRAQVQAWEMSRRKRHRGEGDPDEDDESQSQSQSQAECASGGEGDPDEDDESQSQSQSQAECASGRLDISSEPVIVDTAAPDGQVTGGESDVEYERGGSVSSTAYEAQDAEEHPSLDSVKGKPSSARRSAYEAALRSLRDGDASDWQDLVLHSVNALCSESTGCLIRLQTISLALDSNSANDVRQIMPEVGRASSTSEQPVTESVAQNADLLQSIRSFASEAPSKGSSSSATPWIVGAAALGAGAFGYSFLGSKAPADGPAEKKTSPEAKKIFTGGDQGFLDLKVKEVQDYNHNTKKIVFELPDPDAVSGLHVASAILTKHKPADKEKPTIRPYTPISDEDAKGHLDLLVKVYPNGPMSTHIHSLKPGDTLAIKGPIPKYAWSPNKHDHITLIAGGTGIAPMYQLVRSIFSNPDDKTKVSLVFGNIAEEDILLREEFDKLEKKYGDRFKVFYTLDKPSSSWKHGKGYITKELLKEVIPDPKSENIKVFVCGPPPLYKAISGGKVSPTDQGELDGILKELGYTKEQVYKF